MVRPLFKNVIKPQKDKNETNGVVSHAQEKTNHIK